VQYLFGLCENGCALAGGHISFIHHIVLDGSMLFAGCESNGERSYGFAACVRVTIWSLAARHNLKARKARFAIAIVGIILLLQLSNMARVLLRVYDALTRMRAASACATRHRDLSKLVRLCARVGVILRAWTPLVSAFRARPHPRVKR
jgi:hypothetical protein